MLILSPDPVILTRAGLPPESELDGVGTLSISGSGFPNEVLALRIVEDDGTSFQWVSGPSFSLTVRIVSAGDGHVDVLPATTKGRRGRKTQQPIESASFVAVVS